MKSIDIVPHIPVLLDEVIRGFKDIKSGDFIDCTLGYAGHSYNMLQNYSHINLIGIDRDIEALEFSKKRLKDFKNRVTLLKGSFSEKLNEINFNNVSGLLADFGVSSLQLDKEDRGFNFNSNSLDMRMDQNSSFSAKDVVNLYSQSELEKIFKEYGEAKEYKKVAKAIIEYRKNTPITSNNELTDIILNSIKKKSKIHPATLYFQAIRIEVNKELDEISKLLDILELKKPTNAIIALITFHSLEDRLVKKRFRKWSKKCICPPQSIRCSCGNNNNLGVELNKKPIIATDKEIKQNPRSRSAKLRFFKFK